MRVVTFGEIMLRLAPNGYYRFFQNDQMQATFGGGEANVAVSLANYGLDSCWINRGEDRVSDATFTVKNLDELYILLQ